MSTPASQCIFLLSDKSSGSSIFQHELARHPDVHTLAHTRHHEGETLYWMKAAAVLGLPQVPFVRSELPFTPDQAEAELRRLLAENLDDYQPRVFDEAAVFEGWQRLCETFGPVLFEKSPHHLHQRSALELMLRSRERLDGVDVAFVGLVRNPVDTLYSMWSRWRVRPEASQHEWLRAYRNLRWLQEVLGDDLFVVRYEDLVTDPGHLHGVYRFVGLEPPPAAGDDLHGGAVQKWRADPRFGFVLNEEVLRLAETYGYARAEMENASKPWWPVYREGQALAYDARRHLARLRKRIASA